MTANAERDDPAEWDEVRIFNEALLMMVIERPELSAIVDLVEFDDVILDTAYIACRDADTRKLFANGTRINARLSELIERPVYAFIPA